MAKHYYMPRGENQRRTWLNTFSNNVPSLATKYGITQAEIDNTKDGAVYFSYWLDYKGIINTYNDNLTQWKNELMNGGNATPPVMPALPVAPAKTVTPGIFTRVQSLVKRIKSNIAYNETDGGALGILGSEIDFDPQSMKPAIELRLVGGGFPEIIWKKLGVDAIEIWRMEEGGTWHFLAVDTVPNYIDKTPLPAIGTAKLIKYKAIYKMDDENVGAWSDEVAISVKGA